MGDGARRQEGTAVGQRGRRGTARGAPTWCCGRPRRDDCLRIAELFRIASDGVADYIWSRLQADHPGASLVEIGRRRYARENTAFSYQNCLVAERDGRGDRDAARVRPRAGERRRRRRRARSTRCCGPTPSSSCRAASTSRRSRVLPPCRGQGLGTRLLAAARERARRLGCPALSLICFAQNEGARRLYERAGLHRDRPPRRRAPPDDPCHRRGAADEPRPSAPSRPSRRRPAQHLKEDWRCVPGSSKAPCSRARPWSPACWSAARSSRPRRRGPGAAARPRLCSPPASAARGSSGPAPSG